MADDDVLRQKLVEGAVGAGLRGEGGGSFFVLTGVDGMLLKTGCKCPFVPSPLRSCPAFELAWLPSEADSFSDPVNSSTAAESDWGGRCC